MEQGHNLGIMIKSHIYKEEDNSHNKEEDKVSTPGNSESKLITNSGKRIREENKCKNFELFINFQQCRKIRINHFKSKSIKILLTLS